MQLLIISGFLGSGKTTLLQAIAKSLTDAGRTVAIIENEVGKVGIDDRFLVAQGLQVRELYSGCVCCTLRLDLVATLRAIETELAPDIVILEPSGVASPSSVKDAFTGYDGRLDGCLLLVLVDAPRHELIAKRCAPFFEASVQAADLVVLTKVDAAPTETRAAMLAEFARLNPQAPAFAISAQTGDKLQPFLDEVVRRLTLTGARPADSAPRMAAKPAPRPDVVVCSEELILTFAAEVNAAELMDAVTTLVGGLASNLRDKGHAILGHIKAILEVPGNGYCIVSVTRPDEAPQRRSTLGGPVRNATLRVNAILCGVSSSELAATLRDGLANLQQQFTRPP